MNVIVAGGRDFADQELCNRTIDQYRQQYVINRIISGTARGGDRAGEVYAAHAGIPVDRYPAKWVLHGNAAGYYRNVQMAQNANALIAFWDGKSRGTKHMIDIARERNLHVTVVNY